MTLSVFLKHVLKYFRIYTIGQMERTNDESFGLVV